MPVFLLLLIAWFFAEIWVLLAFARAVGVGPALLWLLAALGLGVALIRLHGLATARRVQEMMARGEFPGPVVLEGLAVVVAGILLAVPGLVSDVLAAILLLRPLRNLVFSWAARRWAVAPPTAERSKHPPPPGVIEGEGRRVADDRDKGDTR